MDYLFLQVNFNAMSKPINTVSKKIEKKIKAYFEKIKKKNDVKQRNK